MDRPPKDPTIAQANLSPSALYQKVNSAEQGEALRAEAKRAAAERKLLAHIQDLTDRVAVLESALRRLQACTVQQFADGRLHLPAGSKLRFALLGPYGQTMYHSVDLAKCTVEAPRPFSAGAPSPAGYVILGTNVNAPGAAMPAGPVGPSLQGLPTSSNGNWQSIASANSMDNPRTNGPATSINPRKR